MSLRESIRDGLLGQLRFPEGMEGRARSGEATFEELRIDSLELVRVLLALQSELRIAMPFRRIAALNRHSKIGDLLDILAATEGK